jgi:hypothetical protein
MQIVNSADLEIRLAVTKAWEKYDLTTAEVTKILANATANMTKYLIRDERHPCDPDKKGDEA